MTTAVKRSTGGTSGSGASYVTGYVLGVDRNVASVRIMGTKIVSVRVDFLRGKSAAPKAGETWIMDQPYGMGWMFAVCLGYFGVDQAAVWTAATTLGAWVNFSSPGTWTPGSGQTSPAGYCLDGIGWVHLRGVVKSGTITNSNAAGPITADILQLPVGYRPGNDGQLLFGVASATGSGQVLVMPDGYVRAVAGTASSVSLNGVHFLAEQ